MKKKAIIYARQSSGSDDYSESVAVQIANCQILAKKQKLQLIGTFSDLNISGKTYPEGWNDLAAADRAYQNWLTTHTSHRQFRKGFGEVINRLDETDYIIVDDITRLYRPLTRSYLEAAVNQALIENQIQILQVKGGELDMARFDQQLITMLKNQINDEQIAKQRQRSIEVLNKIRDSGIMPTGITAFGLIYDRQNKKYQLDPEKCEIIKYIFDRVADQSSFSSIVHEVNERWAEFFGGCFWEKTLREIIRKPIYAGFQYNSTGTLIANHQGEAVISLEKFLLVQEVIEQRRQKYAAHSCNSRTEKRHWLPLSGYLYCGNCGSKLVAAVEKGKISYFCRRGILKKNPLCRNSRIAVKCTEPYLCGLLDAVQSLLGYTLLEQNSICAAQDAKESLLQRYRQNKLSHDEYSALLKQADAHLIINKTNITARLSNQEIILTRKSSGRQKGFSAMAVGRLRKTLWNLIKEASYAALERNLTEKSQKNNYFAKKI